MKKEIISEVLSNNSIAKAAYELRIKTVKGLKIKPGQFANLKIDSEELLLRRPISINAYDEKSGEMMLMYKVVGKGTQFLTQLKKGDSLSIIAPMGHGFDILDRYQSIYLVGGGVGCPPLEATMQIYPDREYISFLGFETKSSVYHEKNFDARSKALYITTVDGSMGEKGLVTEPLKRELDKHVPDVLLACGPMPMLKAIQVLMKDYDCDAFVSVEERMGCGMGGCSVCVCETKMGYKKACVVGPVFRLSEVVF